MSLNKRLWLIPASGFQYEPKYAARQGVSCTSEISLYRVKIKSFIFLALAILFSQSVHSLAKEDLSFGSLKIGVTLDDIEKEYGSPLGYKISKSGEYAFKPYFLFSSFKVYVENDNSNQVPDKNSKIETIEILDSTIHTNKGIKIGDTMQDVKDAYSDAYLQDYFLSNGNHDDYYSEYTGVLTYDVPGPVEHVVGGIGTIEVLVFYFRGDKLVKIVCEKVFA